LTKGLPMQSQGIRHQKTKDKAHNREICIGGRSIYSKDLEAESVVFRTLRIHIPNRVYVCARGKGGIKFIKSPSVGTYMSE
jgi:hypothetical protein